MIAISEETAASAAVAASSAPCGPKYLCNDVQIFGPCFCSIKFKCVQYARILFLLYLIFLLVFPAFAVQKEGGTQLKLIIEYPNDIKALMKPMR